MSDKYLDKDMDSLVSEKKDILLRKQDAVDKIIELNKKYEEIWKAEKAPYIKEVQDFDLELQKINAVIDYKKAFDPVETDLDDMPE